MYEAEGGEKKKDLGREANLMEQKDLLSQDVK